MMFFYFSLEYISGDSLPTPHALLSVCMFVFHRKKTQDFFLERFVSADHEDRERGKRNEQFNYQSMSFPLT